MTAILTALGSGIGARKILEYLMRKSPDLAPKITSALASGISAEKVLKWFSKGNNFEQLKDSMESQYSMNQNANPLVQAQNVRSQNLAPDMASGLQRNAPALLAGAGGLAASMALKHALPNPLKDSIPEIPEKNQGISQSPPIIPQGQPDQSNPIVTQPQVPIQPEVKSINIVDLFKDKPGLKKNIEELSKNVQDPKGVAAILYNKFPREMETLQKQAGKPMEEVIAEYMQSQPKPVKPLDIEPVIEEKKSLTREEALGKFREGIINKGSIAASPQGIGEVKEIRNGKAIIEVDGKKHQVDEDELEEEPEDVVQTVQQLLKIPEVDRSSIVSLFTYDPTESKMYIQFHNGETYKYLDVDPEKVFKVANKMGIPVTEGKNIFGAWSPEDRKSLGATLIKEIINDPKYKKPKKGQEENPNYVKLETLYDYWEKLRKKSKRK